MLCMCLLIINFSIKFLYAACCWHFLLLIRIENTTSQSLAFVLVLVVVPLSVDCLLPFLVYERIHNLYSCFCLLLMLLESCKTLSALSVHSFLFFSPFLLRPSPLPRNRFGVAFRNRFDILTDTFPIETYAIVFHSTATAAVFAPLLLLSLLL